ncbi:MAG: hypothetical protein JWR52_1151 [Marmoricola sp.]|nr:hypothetical protein [Marmoricola sp.]
MRIADMYRLDGKVAVVTGASSGLGVTFAVALADAGADVVLGARREDKLEDTVCMVEAKGRKAVAVRTDVTKVEECRALVHAASNKFGRLDILVNNAGVGTAVPAYKEGPQQFRDVVELNLNATYWMAQAAAEAMGPGSSIINISSVLGMTTAGLPQAAYSASKAGVIGLTRDLAQQWGMRKGIRVNAIAPGFFETEMTAAYERSYIDGTIIPRTLLGRLGRHEEIGAALLFLASDASGYVTGTTLPVEGGMLAT